MTLSPHDLIALGGFILGLMGVIAGAVTAVWRVKGVTRQEIETRAKERVQDAQALTEEWRENYLAERQKAEDTLKQVAEQRALKHAALNENSALKMATDLTAVMQALSDQRSLVTERTDKLEQRMTRRMDAFDANQTRQTEILSELVGAVRDLRTS